MKYDNENNFEKLAVALEDERDNLMSSQRKREYDVIIRRCRDGSYHDFKSELATPKMQMIADLREAGLDQEAQRVMNGDYDQ